MGWECLQLGGGHKLMKYFRANVSSGYISTDGAAYFERQTYSLRLLTLKLGSLLSIKCHHSCFQSNPVVKLLLLLLFYKLRSCPDFYLRGLLIL